MLAFFSSPVQTIAQNTNGLSEQEKKTTINSISDILIDSYVFPEVGKKMSEFIQEKFKDGEYGTIDDAMEFAQQITTDLRSVSNDLHLNVRYMPQNNEGPANMIMAPPVDQLVRLKRDNFGFHEVKILDGNIGYLNLRGFVDTAYGGETAIAAMNFLSNADALIIDLRQNGGEQPSMIQLISSYLFEGSIHLNDFYWRPTDEYSQNWTLPHVPGERMPDIDVYVLTSSYSFSAAEEFAYNLKHLDRATIIGETTRGGAHPGSSFRVGDQFDIWVPQERAINPITDTNWEGTGVKPHIQIEADKALLAGQVEALKSLKKNAQDKWSSKYYDFYLRDLEAEMEPVTLAQLPKKCKYMLYVMVVVATLRYVCTSLYR